MENVTIPTKGRDKQEILDMMQDFRSTDVDFAGGKTWSLVYYLGQEHTDFLKKAYTAFFSENALNPMAFKSLKRFESEVIRMTANMLHGDRDVCGVMTSGGTESCMLSVKTYRDLARAKRPWIRKPEMVVPESIHVAFMKAAEYFDVKLRLRTKENYLQSLYKLLDSAGKLKDKLAVQKEIARVVEEIESLKGRLRFLRQQVAHATVTVRFRQAHSGQKRTFKLPWEWLDELGIENLVR